MANTSFKVGDDVWLIERRPHVAQKRTRTFDPHTRRWKHSYVRSESSFQFETPGWRITGLADNAAQVTGMRLQDGRHVPVTRIVPLADIKASRGSAT